jgi:hypothetical protein
MFMASRHVYSAIGQTLAVATLMIALANCGAGTASLTQVSVSQRPSTSTTTTTSTAQQPLSPPPSPPTATTTSPAPVTSSTVVPISVQSDAQMKAIGNAGPSSSILAPAWCVLDGATVSARGGYTNGGLAPNVYNRYGDVVEVYVYTAPSVGYPGGKQIADLNAEHSPPIGGRGTWTVRAPLIAGLATPRRCVVAALPTHDVQLAP